MKDIRFRSRGFTLIELLVVTAIIAVLAAILFPVFAQAREKARSIDCVSNLHQIGIALEMYISDSDGTYPQEHPYCKNPAVGSATGSGPGGIGPYTASGASGILGDYNGGLETEDFGSPFQKIMPYVAGANGSSENQQLFVCPDDNDPHAEKLDAALIAMGQPACSASAPAPGVTSYLINAYFLFGATEAQIAVPSSTIYVAERNPKFCDVHIHPWLGEIYDVNGYTGAILGNQTLPASIAGNPADDQFFAIASNRHSGGANYVFADGHAKWETYNTAITDTADQPDFAQYEAIKATPQP
jgi:prepilin-type N-terminal cleavage/methylation domain-containing protein/prepilin-type processing-associated H-X9-DG protein